MSEKIQQFYKTVFETHLKQVVWSGGRNVDKFTKNTKLSKIMLLG